MTHEAARIHLAALHDGSLRRLLDHNPGGIGLHAGDRRLQANKRHIEQIAQAYNHLDPYPEAEEALATLGRYRLAVLSNGSPDMLDALVRNSGLARYLEATISVDAKRVFKPHPRGYELVQEKLGLSPHQVLFVSSNGFDVSGAKSFGFRVARIERITPAALRDEISSSRTIGPETLFKALRTQTEQIGFGPDFVVSSLREQTGVADLSPDVRSGQFPVSPTA